MGSPIFKLESRAFFVVLQFIYEIYYEPLLRNAVSDHFVCPVA